MIWKQKKYAELVSLTDTIDILVTSIADVIEARMKEHRHSMMIDVVSGRRKNDSISVQQM